MTELELIERASAIQTKLEMLKQNKNKWKNPERLEKTLMILLHTVEQAIEGELALIRRIQRRIVPKHKELAYDELGNVFEIE